MMAEFVKPKSARLTGNPREQVKKENQERKRSILFLILNYLQENNLVNSAETLEQEAQINNQYTVCDNIDLDIILQEYQSYYYTKFQREPKILRKVKDDEQVIVKKTTSAKIKNKKKVEKIDSNSLAQESDDFQFEIISFSENDKQKTYSGCNFANESVEVIRKPLCDFKGYSQEWREFADQIMSEFVPKNLGVTWEDCIGLRESVELLKEATVYPLKYPELFRGLTSSTWKGILLYGPPGTGKTLLAKALACETSMNFINVTSSTFVSKWRGDSEKMVKVLFDLAKYYAPTTVFVDEIDAVISGDKESSHEASHRFRSELLCQIDGILSSDEQVFVLATTNVPWKLNKALLRRFEKKILVPLPTDDAKIEIFRHYVDMNKSKINKNDLKNLIYSTQLFSGADIKTVCKEVEMSLVREELKEINTKKNAVSLRPPCLEDLVKAVKTVKPSINMNDYNKYVEWTTCV